MLILNADDFGYNAALNEAIVASLEAGLCSSATLLANMEGFAEACQVAHERGLLEFVGLHLNLSEGEPLTEPLRRLPRFCDAEGRFRMQRERRRVLGLSGEERRALAGEIRAQIARARAQRLPLTHLDSHNHLHEEWGILATLLPIAREAGIPFVRLARNFGRPTGALKHCYRLLVNQKISRCGLARTRFFGTLPDYLYARERGGTGHVAGSCELMVHPGRDAAGTLVDWFHKKPLAELVAACAFAEAPVSYAGAAWPKQGRSR